MPTYERFSSTPRRAVQFIAVDLQQINILLVNTKRNILINAIYLQATFEHICKDKYAQVLTYTNKYMYCIIVVLPYNIIVEPLLSLFVEIN